ncbi:hypothetical protein ACL02R_07500 [Streptomyces sp. MS19]|uniref:DUF7848 domain-containing protein n=1 Tax=Streptomyces sp. MS19 TaxID=3385972 RepID=UPI0039A24908
MGTRYRFRNWTLTPKREAEAEPVKVAYECADCGEMGPTDENAEAAQAWTFDHLRENPRHVNCRQHSVLPYTMIPGDFQ